MVDAEIVLSSLVVTLAAAPERRAAGLRALQARPDLELGVGGGCWVPAVLTSADPQQAFGEIERLPGVELVEVVLVELPAAAPA